MDTVTKPFAGYVDFADCVSQNQDKKDPEAYCASIEQQVNKVSVNPGAGMIALFVPPEIAETLALDREDAEKPGELHVTLCYFSDAVSYRGEIEQAAQAISKSSPPIEVEISGIAQFTSEDEKKPNVLLINSHDLLALRSQLVSLLPEDSYSEKHAYTPHITLAYLPPDESLSLEGDFPSILFPAISVTIDGERTDFPFSGSQEMAVVDNIKASLETDAVLGLEVSQQTSNESEPVSTTEKAVWSTAFVNDLPDSAFLFIETGGEKDEDGKTAPRSLRHFPYRDADGAVDLPHLRNAIARIPQSDAEGLTPEKVQSLQNRARELLREETEEKIGKRMSGQMLDKLRAAMSTISSVMSWAGYDDGNDDHESMMGEEKKKAESFVVFKQEDGSSRWVSLSSNAFQDREGEIVSTKSLEEAVENAAKAETKGPLLLWHVPAAKIGDCDFQAVHERFLIESGTFADTALAKKALDYFNTTDETLGVSIGFKHLASEKESGVYNRIRIIERSVCPLKVAANPWTTFQALRGVEMNDAQKEWLEKVTSKEFVTNIMSATAKASEALEAGVAYKADVIDATKDGEKQTDPPGSQPDPQPNSQPDITADLEKALTPIADAVKTLAEKTAEFAGQISENQKTFAEAQQALDERLKALEAEAQERKEKTARGTDVYRASQAKDNILEKDKTKDVLGADDAPVNPVAAYIEDLTKTGVIR